MSESQQEQEITPQISKCLQLLRGPSDNEVFVGLLLIIKVLPQPPPHIITLIYESVGLDFLKRLLLTKKDSSSNVENTDLRTLSLTILSIFCTVEDIIKQEKFVELIPLILPCVQECVQNKDFETLTFVESYKIICSILYNCGNNATREFYEYGGLQLFSSIITQTISNEFSSIDVMLYIIQKESPNWNQLQTSLPFLATTFDQDNTPLKFQILHFLNNLFTITQIPPKLEAKDNPLWLVAIKNGLNSILGSKVGKEQRDPALILTSIILSLFGFEWAFGERFQTQQFAHLIVQLTRVEIQILLGEIIESPLENENKKMVVFRCFKIVSCFVEFLRTIDIENLSGLHFDILQASQKALEDIFKSIMTFICDCDKSLHKELASMSIPLLGLWLEEETEAQRPLITTTLPHIFTIIENSTIKHNLISSFLPALVTLSADPITQSTLEESSGHPSGLFLVVSFIASLNTIQTPSIQSACEVMLNIINEKELSNEKEIDLLLSLVPKLVYIIQDLDRVIDKDCLLIVSTLFIVILSHTTPQKFSDLTQKNDVDSFMVINLLLDSILHSKSNDSNFAWLNHILKLALNKCFEEYPVLRSIAQKNTLSL